MDSTNDTEFPCFPSNRLVKREVEGDAITFEMLEQLYTAEQNTDRIPATGPNKIPLGVVVSDRLPNPLDISRKRTLSTGLGFPRTGVTKNRVTHRERKAIISEDREIARLREAYPSLDDAALQPMLEVARADWAEIMAQKKVAKRQRKTAKNNAKLSKILQERKTNMNLEDLLSNMSLKKTYLSASKQHAMRKVKSEIARPEAKVEDSVSLTRLSTLRKQYVWKRDGYDFTSRTTVSAEHTNTSNTKRPGSQIYSEDSAELMES